MATTIVTKYGSDAPAASDLVRGELAVDTENGRLYTENSSGAVVEIGLNPEGNVDVTGTVTADKLITDSGVDAASFTSTGSTYVDINNGTVTGRLQTISSDFFIGTATVGTSLAFKSGNNVEAMRISSTGNVGIGTDSPFFTTAGRVSLSVNGTSSSILAFGKGGSSENYLLADAGGFTIANTSATLPTTFFNNGAERMSIDSSGSVGIGITPKTTNATVTGSFNVNQAGLLVRNSNQAYFASNIYWDASDQLKSYAAGYGLASLFVPSDGSHRFFNTTAAATGADQNLTLNETMRIDSSGNTTFKANNSAVGPIVTLENTATAVNGQAWGSIHFDSNDSSTGASGTRASIIGTSTSFNGDGNLTFSTAPANGSNTERMRLDSSGNLLVGESADFLATSTTATGLAVTQDGRFTLSRSGIPMNVSRLGSDGSLIDFWRQGATVGSIGTSAGHLYVGNGDTNLIFNDTANSIYPWDSSANDVQDATVDLGANTARFKDLYLSGVMAAGDGSATAPSVRGTDTNTGLFFPSGGVTAITRNGVEGCRLGCKWEFSSGEVFNFWRYCWFCASQFWFDKTYCLWNCCCRNQQTE